MKKIVTIILLIILSIGIFKETIYKGTIFPKATKGVMNLENWDFVDDGAIKLDGQWEVYWNQLLTPKDFANNHSLVAKGYMELPGALVSSTNKLTKQGYGTIRLNIARNKHSLDKMQFGIKAEYILSASKIWINGDLLSSVGVVGKNAIYSTESYERQIAFFVSESRNIEIVIQMSNFDNIMGKIKSIIIGNSKQIKRDYIKGAAQDAFIVGSLFIISIYHIILFVKRTKNKAPLYFGIFCLITAFRNFLVGQRLVFEIFPNISFTIFNKMAYLTLYLAVPFVVLFFREIFPQKVSAKTVHFITTVSIMLSLTTLLTNIEFYDQFLMFYEIAVVVIFAYILFIVVQAAINKNQSATIILIGFSVLLLTIIHDMLVQAGVIFSSSLSPAGLLFFVFIQSYMLATEFSTAFSDIEKLVEENKAVFIDELTGILNRRGFYEYGNKLFEASKNKENKLIVFYGDLNKLKNINDSFGHKEGDEAIKNAAELIKNSFHKDDIVARMSGDEFITIAANKSVEDAEGLLAHVISNFNQYNVSSHKPYNLSIGFGYSTFNPNTNVTLDELISEADTMLYKEKHK